jgi:hypothetical protein
VGVSSSTLPKVGTESNTEIEMHAPTRRPHKFIANSSVAQGADDEVKAEAARVEQQVRRNHAVGFLSRAVNNKATNEKENFIEDESAPRVTLALHPNPPPIWMLRKTRLANSTLTLPHHKNI